MSIGLMPDYRRAGGGIALLENIRGDEAAGIFLAETAIRPQGRGLVYLRDLALRFSEMPYENISKIIKNAGSVGVLEAMRMPAEVVTEHFEKGFGGTCFSLTFLLERMLTALGFDCYKVMADMNSGKNVHCLVIVREGDGGYMIDPGYALYEVIELPGEGVSAVMCPHALVEVEFSGADEPSARYDLWTSDASGRKWRYTFKDIPVSDADFERHWIESFSKPTLHNICLTRMTERGHIYFRKDFFKFTSRQAIDKRRLKHDIEAFIADEFGIGREWTNLAQRLLKERRSEPWRS
jgi:arylamine N-acetyltransferase